ncbi:Arc family DNA-binding protein [Gluconobacter sp. R75690]|uniref:Arc family DNA-binding protein n=1 Tax=unclassified Gluconobacter TaxID=2644261 RepID=UPI00188BE233|nr:MULTISPECIES: Arc family DNA-binding protein [unclassified Gluconobacter]MBF0851022.1 Arc family DNA-binding protein [Gluconobacter sp. R75690]MBF0879714.1 Arc family DNA-binding protein [Gluconobacter sp. R75828]
MAKHTDPSFKLRIPTEVLDHLREIASKTERSMGSYIVFMLRQDMHFKKASGASLATTPNAFSSDSEQGNHCDDAE